MSDTAEPLWAALIEEKEVSLLGVTATAVFDATRTYRYLLTRTWSAEPPLTFAMLNSSTADAFVPDPTIRRCVCFAEREGAGGIQVINLFAYRSPYPEALPACKDPVGPRNREFIRRVCAEGGTVVLAWGAHHLFGRTAALSRWQQNLIVRAATEAQASLQCLGITKNGHPRHPLYVRADTPLTPWSGKPVRR